MIEHDFDFWVVFEYTDNHRRMVLWLGQTSPDYYTAHDRVSERAFNFIKNRGHVVAICDRKDTADELL